MNANIDVICEIAKYDVLVFSKLCVIYKDFNNHVEKNENYYLIHFLRKDPHFRDYSYHDMDKWFNIKYYRYSLEDQTFFNFCFNTLMIKMYHNNKLIIQRHRNNRLHQKKRLFNNK